MLGCHFFHLVGIVNFGHFSTSYKFLSRNLKNGSSEMFFLRGKLKSLNLLGSCSRKCLFLGYFRGYDGPEFLEVAGCFSKQGREEIRPRNVTKKNLKSGFGFQSEIIQTLHSITPSQFCPFKSRNREIIPWHIQVLKFHCFLLISQNSSVYAFCQRLKHLIWRWRHTEGLFCRKPKNVTPDQFLSFLVDLWNRFLFIIQFDRPWSVQILLGTE